MVPVSVRGWTRDRKSTRLNSSHTEIYTLSLHDALPISALSKAIDNVANSHGAASVPLGGGNYGSGIRPRVDTRGNLEILSDTMGVDFGPYMQRLRRAVQEHWDPLIPQSAMPPEMKRGTVIIEFAILKDGKVAGLR